MFERGVAYAINGLDTVAVVLTKNSWNNRMLSVGAVPISPRQETSSPLALRIEQLHESVADVTRLVVVGRENLGRAEFVLDDEQMHAVERALGDLIDSRRLLADSPRGNRPPPGAIDYPRWGEIYYRRGEQFGGETKRYLVVSNDLWNQRKTTVLVARTTTQTKHPTEEFPLVQQGEAQVVCGELAAVAPHNLDLDQRPQGQIRLGLGDMAQVARGVTHTHLLRDHLDEFEPEVSSIEPL